MTKFLVERSFSVGEDQMLEIGRVLGDHLERLRVVLRCLILRPPAIRLVAGFDVVVRGALVVARFAPMQPECGRDVPGVGYRLFEEEGNCVMPLAATRARGSP